MPVPGDLSDLYAPRTERQHQLTAWLARTGDGVRHALDGYQLHRDLGYTDPCDVLLDVGALRPVDSTWDLIVQHDAWQFYRQRLPVDPPWPLWLSALRHYAVRGLAENSGCGTIQTQKLVALVVDRPRLFAGEPQVALALRRLLDEEVRAAENANRLAGFARGDAPGLPLRLRSAAVVLVHALAVLGTLTKEEAERLLPQFGDFDIRTLVVPLATLPWADRKFWQALVERACDTQNTSDYCRAHVLLAADAGTAAGVPFSVVLPAWDFPLDVRLLLWSDAWGHRSPDQQARMIGRLSDTQLVDLARALGAPDSSDPILAMKRGASADAAARMREVFAAAAARGYLHGDLLAGVLASSSSDVRAAVLCAIESAGPAVPRPITRRHP